MSEFWKSNPRKFCDFCKCWLADNKISISIHENGKGHKEMVQKKISSSHKASVKKEKEEVQAKKLFQQMEKNANKAYEKDLGNVSSTAPAFFESVSIGPGKSNQNPDAKGQKQKRTHDSKSGSKKFSKHPKMEPNDEPENSLEPEWFEFKTNSGQPYFIHVETNETTWVKPENAVIMKVHDNVAVAETKSQDGEKSEPEKKGSAFRDVSTVTGYRSSAEVNGSTVKMEAREGAKGRELAYGSFQLVANDNQSDSTKFPIKLDLPEQTDNSHLFSHLPREAFEDEERDEKLQITEKKIEISPCEDDFGSENGIKKEASSLFKKRKFGGNKNRNIKQRDDF